MSKLLWMIVGMLALMMPLRSYSGDLVVIVNAKSPVGKLTRDEVVNIFMGRYRKLPDGEVAVPLDVGEDSEERRSFYRELVGKSLPEIDAYWARLVFSGRTSAPLPLASQQRVQERVGSDRNAIAYIERRNLNKSVKVVYEFSD